MCNCHSETTAKLREHVTAQLPEGAVGLDLELGGYVFGLGGPDGLSHRAALPVQITYQAPKKTGGMKSVKQKISMRATYCPFCGVKYEKDAE